MIVVKIELWQATKGGAVCEIGRMLISNVGGTNRRRNYRALVLKRCADFDAATVRALGRGDKSAVTREAEIHGFPSLSYNVWRLVARLLRSCFPEEDNPNRERLL
jgi:hypothetical protein